MAEDRGLCKSLLLHMRRPKRACWMNEWMNEWTNEWIMFSEFQVIASSMIANRSVIGMCSHVLHALKNPVPGRLINEKIDQWRLVKGRLVKRTVRQEDCWSRVLSPRGRLIKDQSIRLIRDHSISSLPYVGLLRKGHDISWYNQWGRSKTNQQG